MDKANKLVTGSGPESAKFTEDLKKVYRGILNTVQTPHFTLIMTGYAVFFNSETSYCNNKSLRPLPWGAGGPKLSKKERRKLNVLTHRLNDKIRGIVAEVNAEYKNKWIRFYNIDPQFEGHRFCDVDGKSNEWTGDNFKDKAWFLTVFGEDIKADGIEVLDENSLDAINLRTMDLSQCSPTATIEDPMFHACMYAEMIQASGAEEPLEEADGTDFIVTEVQLEKAFHPKTIAHAVSAERTYQNFRSLPGANRRKKERYIILQMDTPA